MVHMCVAPCNIYRAHIIDIASTVKSNQYHCNKPHKQCNHMIFACHHTPHYHRAYHHTPHYHRHVHISPHTSLSQGMFTYHHTLHYHRACSHITTHCTITGHVHNKAPLQRLIPVNWYSLQSYLILLKSNCQNTSQSSNCPPLLVTWSEGYRIKG